MILSQELLLGGDHLFSKKWLQRHHWEFFSLIKRLDCENATEYPFTCQTKPCSPRRLRFFLDFSSSRHSNALSSLPDFMKVLLIFFRSEAEQNCKTHLKSVQPEVITSPALLWVHKPSWVNCYTLVHNMHLCQKTFMLAAAPAKLVPKYPSVLWGLAVVLFVLFLFIWGFF